MRRKIAIAGSGTIGTTVAYSLFLRCSDTEIVLVSRNAEKSYAKVFDISHCSAVFDDRSISYADYSSW